MATITEREAGQIEAANAGGRTPVVFIHGLWLLASSWERWAALFEEAGYAPVLAEWPDDPATVEEARANPDALAGKSVGQVAAHMGAVIAALNKKSAVIGHSFGGLMAQIVAGRGLSAASVAVDPAPFRGVLPLPLAAIQTTSPSTSSATAGPMLSGTTSRSGCTRPTTWQPPACRSSRRRWRTSIPRPRSRSTARIPSVARC
jgi:pimeloyl-ACP methyl ester carboxylesterase